MSIRLQSLIGKRERGERARCGTGAASWQAHRNRGEMPCDDCKRGRRAENRALTRLALEYPERFAELFLEEFHKNRYGGS